MNVRLACFTRAFFNELLSRGVEREQAITWVAGASWQIYRLWAKAAAIITKRLGGGRTALAFAVAKRANGRDSVSLHFPFNAPGYVIETVAAPEGTAFNVLRCPIAEYFRTHNEVDLCTQAWCNLDYPLANLTGEILLRTKTLVRGDGCCDFRLNSRTPSPDRCRGASASAAIRKRWTR